MPKGTIGLNPIPCATSRITKALVSFRYSDESGLQRSGFYREERNDRMYSVIMKISIKVMHRALNPGKNGQYVHLQPTHYALMDFRALIWIRSSDG